MRRMLFVLVLSCGWAGIALGAEGERVSAEVRERLADAGHVGGALVVHYRRADAGYGGWNLWAWPEGGAGAAYGFGDGLGGETAYGVYAVVPVERGVERVGFVVRRGAWELKDVDRDRFVRFGEDGATRGEVREVWLMSGDGRVYGDPGDVDTSLRVVGAFLDGGDAVLVTLSGAPGDGVVAGAKVLRDGEAGVYGVREWSRRTPGSGARGVTYELRLDEEVAFEDVSALTLRVPGVSSGDWDVDEAGDAIVYARGVLEEARFYDTEAELGAVWGETSTVFRVWSPVSDRVEVLLYGGADSGGLDAEEPVAAVELSHAGLGVWEAEVAGDLHGVVYRIAYESYGERRVAADIHCRAASADSSRSVIVDMSRTDPEGWEELSTPVAKRMTDEIIYEVHVRDFSVFDASLSPRFRGTYLGLVNDGSMETPYGEVRAGVGHLEELGVTAVHLLPVQDFGAAVGEYNWGYWTSLFNVAEGNYATDPFDPLAGPRELKLAIAGLHARGIRVILDVVYNHTSSSHEWSPFFQSVPYYWFRTTVDGRLRNDAGVGNSMADGRAMVRDYIGDSLEYWLEEYAVDGFRFDLLGTHRPESVRGWVARMRGVRPDATLYGEPWTGGGPLYFGKGEQRGMGIAVFNDDLRNAVRGDLDGTATGFATGEGGGVEAVREGVRGMVGAWAASPDEVVNYVSAHDNLTFWDKLLLAQPGVDDETRRAMQKLAHGVMLTSRGIAFIHLGADFCRTKGGNHNSYNAGDGVNGIRWERKGECLDVFEYVRGLIGVRRSFDVLRDDVGALSFVDVGGGAGVVAFEASRVLPRSGYRLFVAYNGGAESASIRVPSGSWRVLVDADEAGVEPRGEVGVSYEMPAWSMVVFVEPGA